MEACENWLLFSPFRITAGVVLKMCCILLQAAETSLQALKT